ncbi:MAG: RidA family protein [Candidatus Saccharimonadales bacterium]
MAGNTPFADQAALALDNLNAVAKASRLSLKHAVEVHPDIRNLRDREAFDQVYANYIGDPPPARTLVQFTFFDIEVDAILLCQ